MRINTGPSGSAMVSFLVNGQIESAFGSEIAGVSNHNLDPNVVVVAQATRLVRWIAIVGRNIDNLDQLRGKKVGIARGSVKAHASRGAAALRALLAEPHSEGDL